MKTCTLVKVSGDGAEIYPHSVYTIAHAVDMYPRIAYEDDLYRCNADVWSTATGEYVLRSYRTFVAVYDPSRNELHDILRTTYGYTSTSAKHIALFSRWITENFALVPRVIRYVPDRTDTQESDDAEIDIPAES